MALNQNSGEVISLGEAQELIRAFQTNYPNDKKAFFVGSNHYQAILDQEGCIGVRIYNAYDEVNQTKTVVLIGVDDKDNDMKTGIIVDRAVICPPHCSIINILD
jgi:hypothetical protein